MENWIKHQWSQHMPIDKWNDQEKELIFDLHNFFPSILEKNCEFYESVSI